MINEIMGTLWRECALLMRQNKRKEACGVYAAVVRLTIMHAEIQTDKHLRNIFSVLEILPEAARYAEPIIDMATPLQQNRFAILKTAQFVISHASRRIDASSSSPPLFS